LTLIDQVRPWRVDVADIEPPHRRPSPVRRPELPPRRRVFAGRVLTLAAAVLVYLALVVPDGVLRVKAGTWVPGAFLRVPIEPLVGVALLLALPVRWRRRVALLSGAGLGLLAVLKIVNMGFRLVLGRRFNSVLDWPLFRDGYHALTETDGRTVANLAVAGAVLLAVVVTVAMTLAVKRLARSAARHSRTARRAVLAVSAVWLALALSGLTLYPYSPVASDSAAVLVKSTVKEIPAALRDQRHFAAAAQADPFRDVPAAQLLDGLTGKDVVVGVVESYGRTVLEDPAMSAILDPELRAGEQKLAAAGYTAKSGFLTSSTFGGGSWLAHASFQSGLWINSQQRYHQLTASNRRTLTSAFRDAGWQTVGVEPGNTVAWPEASFYGYQQVYDSRNLGYQGPKFGWSRMPDQYTLAAFQREVYGKPHRPLMAEITLTSSHEPWNRIPDMVDWNRIGDGTVFGPMARTGEDRKQLWSDPAKTRAAYARSVAYSMDSLVSWAEKYGDDNLVLVIFGDHQPMPIVSGPNAGHDIPVTIVAHSPQVLDRIASWGWNDGLKPSPSAPVWRMDAFRDKFFTAFGSQTAAALSAPR
jgi:sulfatase-like protein